ncbi:ABC transporter permease [Sutterella megalosphaeroides]|uniref:ABC transporter permease n=1 Tax=Sutterella megalosphaeroides TaxID=2494234 RepID=A0A2Z6IB23_9BURK|nr:ABC transporter permease [Sutterella megalosphaeroides]BBF23659.1 ABC transporter permease [Sutterella megalosphaeroides]
MLPLSTRRIASANLAQKPFRSLSLALVVAIFAFMLFAGSMISANLQSGISSLSARMGADLLVVPQGSGKKMESVLLRAEPSTFYIDESVLDVVKDIPTVAQASGQLFISSLDAQCCTVKVQLIGIDQSTDFVVEPWLRKAVDRPLTGNEVIVGDYIFGEIGSEITFYNQKFTIVGRLEPSGMGFDSSVFMSMEAARRIAHIASPDMGNKVDKAYSSILVRVKPGVDPISISDEVLDRMGLKANVNFVFASNMMSDTSAKLQNIVTVMYSAAAGVWLVAALVMFVVFFFAFNERQKEFATLRALGATKSKVISIVMTESFLMSLAGTVVGMFFGWLFLEVFSVSIAKAIGLPYLSPASGAFWGTVVTSAVAGLVTCPLATLPTAWRIGRKDIYTSLREGE